MKVSFAPLLALAIGVVPLGALAQSSPAPAPQSSPMPDPSPAYAPSTSAPMQTMAPAPSSGSSTGTAAPKTSTTTTGGDSNAKPPVKKIPSGSLSMSDVRYGLTHPLQEANQIRKMKTVSFDKLRVYRLSSGLKSVLKISDANSDIPALAMLGPGVLVAQTSGMPSSNGSNSPIAYLQYVLANINVSNALNNVNVLNNSTVNVGVTLQDVLNGNKISIGSVAGIFVNSLGIITTITK